MKAVLQRARQAYVSVEGTLSGKVAHGLVVLFCAEEGDTEADAEYFARKIAAMRIFEDEAGKMNLSVRDVGGGALVVSQFTLAADWKKGNRPSFSGAAAPEVGNSLYHYFCARLEGEGVPVETGVFGASMAVGFINEGPVTIVMDSG